MAKLRQHLREIECKRRPEQVTMLADENGGFESVYLLSSETPSP
jgi:hypothetical protein